MIILDNSMFPWPRTDPSGYWQPYESVVNNFKKSCIIQYPDHKILFIDNTYLQLDQVIEAVRMNNCDVHLVFNMIDPPFTWHYLKEQLSLRFPNKKFIFIGMDHAPDFYVNFGFIWFYKTLKYPPDQELMPVSMDYTFLSYNYKPHEHRTKLIAKMKEQQVIQMGYCTMPRDNANSPHVLSNDLGDLNIWKRHFLNVVSKAVFRPWSEPLGIGEKFFKPIVGLRPFIINGSPRYYHEFKSLGFDCFDDIFPVQDLMKELSTNNATMDKNHQIICDVIKDLHTKDLMNLYQTLLPRLLANRSQWEKLCKQYTQQFCIDSIALNLLNPSQRKTTSTTIPH